MFNGVLKFFIISTTVSQVYAADWSLNSVILGAGFSHLNFNEKNAIKEVSESGNGGSVIAGLHGTLYNFENWSTYWKIKNQLSKSNTIYDGYIQSASGFEKKWNQNNEWQDIRSTVQVDGVIALSRYVDFKVTAGFDALHRSRDLQQYKEIFKVNYPIFGCGFYFKISDELNLGFETLSSINSNAKLIVPKFDFSKNTAFQSASKTIAISWRPKMNLQKDEWQLSFGHESFTWSATDAAHGMYFPGGHDERKAITLSWLRHWR